MKKFAVVAWPEHLKGHIVEIVSSPSEGVFNTTDAETGEPRVMHADNLDFSTKEHGYIRVGKFSSARDDILHFLCVSEWGNESFGDVEAPTGYVWRISNNWEEVKPENTEFTSVLEDWLDANEEVTDSPALRKELVGHFLITEDSNGLVTVEEFPTETALKNRFGHLEECFNTWNEEEEA